MTGGTEAFPDLGRHCQLSDCHQLDFLPFQCDGCRKVFCVEHRSYKSHECPKSDHNSRKVVVCEICSASIETTGRDGEQDQKLSTPNPEIATPERRRNQSARFAGVRRFSRFRIPAPARPARSRFASSTGSRPTMFAGSRRRHSRRWWGRL